MKGKEIVVVTEIPSEEDFREAVQAFKRIQEEERKAFGKQLRFWREEALLSTAELASMLGTSRQFIDALEKGKENLPVRRIRVLAEALKQLPETLRGRLPPVLRIPAWTQSPLGRISIVHRLRQSLSSSQLAQRSHLSVSKVSELERGSCTSGVRVQARLFEGLGIEVAEGLLPLARPQGRPR